MIRDYQPSDCPAIEAVHDSSKFDYQFPDLNDSLFIVKKVCDEEGVRHAIAIKLEGTTFLWIDHSHGTPEDRWQRMRELVEEAKREAWLKGLDCLSCVIPPELEASFEKRLLAIGMTKDRPWPKYSFDLTQYIPSH